MSHSLFVSDLHLCPSRPAIYQTFLQFLRGPATRADALYILGDLFDYWVGDDDAGDPIHAGVAGALNKLHEAGSAIYLMHGNRDFLIAEGYAAISGATLLPDPTLADLHGTRTLLMHGDTLCTDDVDYQKFRTKVRNRDFQREFLARPLAARKEEVARLRGESNASKQSKSATIMDVNCTAVENALREHGYPRLIHGHTHRPAMHEHIVDGHRCERWVLADWYTSGSYLHCDAADCRVIKLATT